MTTEPKTIADAWDQYRFRSLITRNAKAPILGAWVIVQGPVLPIPDEVLRDVPRVLAEGGSFLILASNNQDRTVAKQALMVRFCPVVGAA